MPRRTANSATPAPSAPLPPPPHDLSSLAQSDPEWAANLTILRRHWKWANFSQFFYTFAPLLNMPDVFLSDVEDDLARGTNVHLPRIMHRLLYTLSQDRKLTIDNWQTALRRQYLRRDPSANPIGPEPKAPSRESSVSPSENADEENNDDTHSTRDDIKPSEHPQADKQPDQKPRDDLSERRTMDGPSLNPKAEPEEESKLPQHHSDGETTKVEEVEESRDWLDLPMLDKLDSMHLLTEWQFQNPYRVRQLMKDDDDAANWRIEPIGYDAKTNAYWLIGPDRLWIQRAPPRPPRSRNLKRKRPVPTPKKSARPKAAESSSDEEEEDEVAPTKRTRLQSQPRARTSQANGRATRASRRQSSNVDADLISPGKSTRAAKVQANKKLDLQAKELAEFQRQAAALASAKARSSPRKSGGASSSPSKRAVGTRVSARIRNTNKGPVADDDGDEEWQQVPQEWLQDSETPEPRTRTRTRSRKGKARAEPEDDAEESDEAEEVEAGVEEDGHSNADGDGAEENEVADAGEATKDADVIESTDDLLQKAGLESGSISDLTELSDQEEAEEEEEPPAKPQRGRKADRRKSVRTTTRARNTRRAAEPSPSKSKSSRDSQPEPDEDHDMDEPPTPPLPEGFVEWEAIAITLNEWEHVAEPFEKATHYLEKALYKMLTQNIIPIVMEELQEIEKRRRLEEAIVHRKRSSRIAMKESEKEEARMAARKKAEEEEKLARTKRQEARQRKEEAERAKREHAREQRRKEREEREARAKAKQERVEREEAVAARSTATPSVNGTHPSSSLHQSRVVSPNGIRTPDWVLDCEVCHRQGVNMDDGQAMVSCGSCSRWQHIKCHDLNDQRTGRPRRDWEKQQFFCLRCRQRANGGGYGSQGYPMPPQQHSWTSQSGHPIHLHKPGGVDPYAHTSDMRYSHRSTIENGMGYAQHQPYLPNNVGVASYSRSSYPNTGFAFDHHQSDQRGLSSRAVPVTSQGSWSSGSGYGAAPDPLAGRMSSAPYGGQYAQNGSMYGGSRLPSAYQQPSSATQYNTTHDASMGMHPSRWTSPTSNGYRSPAMQEAAQSLAFMHDAHSSRYNSSSWPAPAVSYSQPAPGSSSQGTHHSSYAHAPVPAGIDPLTGQSFPRVEQRHVGHGLPHTNGTTSFNFP